MATVNIPYTFSNGSPVVASEHNANWDAIEAFTNAMSAGTNFDTGAIGTVSIAAASITTFGLILLKYLKVAFRSSRSTSLLDIPITGLPMRVNSLTIAEPARPVAPATKIVISIA